MENDCIKVDIEGNLLYKGEQLTHHKIVEFFKKLDFDRIDEKDYELKWQNGDVTQKIKVVPEDTLFVVKDVVREGSEIKLVLNDETMETLDTKHLSFKENVPYALIKRNRVIARFNRHAAFKLGEIILGQ